MALRWGIAGVGKITHDFCTALKSPLPTKDHIVAAIASRDVERSKEFAESHGIAKYYGSYQDLAKDNSVEIVYITVLNPYHYEVCKLMINHGKHVLCEKPFCMNSWQAKEVFDLAKSKGVFVMEAIWSRFFPAYTHLRKMIDSGSLGEVREIYIKHGFKAEGSDRLIKKDMGGGLVLDIGVYAIQFVLFCFREEPSSIKATGKTNQEGVDLQFEVELQFSGGRFAKLICSGLEEYNNQATVVSTKGTVCVPTYWCPTSILEPDCNIKNWPLPATKFSFNFTNSCGLAYEADAVYDCVKSGKLSSEIVEPQESLNIAYIQDEIRRQIGVRYDCDKP